MNPIVISVSVISLSTSVLYKILKANKVTLEGSIPGFTLKLVLQNSVELFGYLEAKDLTSEILERFKLTILRIINSQKIHDDEEVESQKEEEKEIKKYDVVSEDITVIHKINFAAYSKLLDCLIERESKNIRKQDMSLELAVMNYNVSKTIEREIKQQFKYI